MTDCNFCQRVRDWINKPFEEEGNVFDWFLFLGMVGGITWLWSRILKRIMP